MITLVDSAIANIGSVRQACDRIGAATEVSDDPGAVAAASALILPGVGSFADGMAALRRLNLVDPIRCAVQNGAALLGICLGMQLLAEVGEEYGEHAGLGLIRGSVTRLQPTRPGERVPNIGWCDIAVNGAPALFEGLDGDASFYFMHSYALACADPRDCTAVIGYGQSTVCAAVERGRIAGVQFHPEKSQDAGLRVLYNFARLAGEEAAHVAC